MSSRQRGSWPLGVAGLYNFSPSSLPHYRAVLPNVKTNTSNVHVACIGDSTTAGFAASVGNDSRPLSYPSAIVTNFPNSYLNPSVDSFWGSANEATNAAYTAYDPRVVFDATVPGWLANGAQTSLGGPSFQCTTTNGVACTFTPANAFDTIATYYVDGNVASKHFTIDVGGSVLTTVTTNATTNIVKVITNVGSTASLVNFKKTTGSNITIVGCETYLSTKAQVSLWNMGYGGSQVSGWTATTGGSFAPFNAIPTVAPDLTIFCLGINDWKTLNVGNTIAPIWVTGYQSLINQALLSGDVILIGPPPSAVGVASIAEQAAYISIIKSLATINNCPFLDFTTRWGSNALAQTNGFMNSGQNLHPTAAGYADMAQAIGSIVLSL